MPLTVTCPSCGKPAGIPEDAAGKRVLCPHCREAFAATPAAVPVPFAEPEPEPRRAPYECPRCGSPHVPPQKEEISPGGWITFGSLLGGGLFASFCGGVLHPIFCAIMVVPLVSWLPLVLMRRRYSICPKCGLRTES